MATAATESVSMLPSLSAPSKADERLEHIKYRITTTPPQPRRRLEKHDSQQEQQEDTEHDFSKEKQQQPQQPQQQQQHSHQPHQHKHSDDERKEDATSSSSSSAVPAKTTEAETAELIASSSHSPDYDKEDACHRLHPSLHFIPLDREHPPKEIRRAASPSTSLSPARPAAVLANVSRASSPSPATRSRSLTTSPADSPSQSPSGSPSAATRRLSARHQRRQSESPAPPSSRAADGADGQSKGPSKLRLLAPPPINSSSGRRGSRQSDARSRSPSPSPSPSPPPSPYLSPEHPRRRASFSVAINSVFPVAEALAAAAPNKLRQHPFVLYPALFIGTLLLALPVLGLPFTAPLRAVGLGLSWAAGNFALVAGMLAVVLSVLAVIYRRVLLQMYRAVFLPPVGSALPRPFAVEEIDLNSEQWSARAVDWAEQIDQHNGSGSTPAPSAAATTGSASPSPAGSRSPSVSSPTDVQHGSAAASDEVFESLSAINMLALMQSYQRGEVDDCSFVCLRVFLTDASLNRTEDGDDTVALIFLSIRHHYDLSPYFLRMLTPIQACFPFLCAPALLSQTIRRWLSFRFAVIGFHWPFRSCIAFTKPASEFAHYLQLKEHPLPELTSAEDEQTVAHVARYTAMLQLARQWDASLPRNKQSDFMLFPVLASSPVVDAIPAAGGSALPILPTYVVDLREVKGGGWQDFKRLLRRQFNRKVREGPFEGAGGNSDVTEGDQVTEQQVTELCRLWHQVADYRGNKDQTACLMEPNTVFVQELCHHPARFIRLLSLKLKDVTVAASLLFSLSPSVMTSDVAGFNYPALEAAGKEANQQIKAYPVKLAAVVKEAISSGYEWVDFGPTTGASKMELGAREIPLTGGLFYHGTITSVVVKIAATCLSRQHAVAKKAYD